MYVDIFQEEDNTLPLTEAERRNEEYAQRAPGHLQILAVTDRQWIIA